MTTQQNKWNADAEASMMGFTVAVESREHLLYMTRYILKVVKSYVYTDDDTLNYHSDRIVADATHKYRSGSDKNIYWFTTNSTAFGMCLTFVRDKGALTLKSGKMKASGSLAWVENLDAPDCSELGYVFFESVNGKVRRIA